VSVYLQIDRTVGPIQIASNEGYGDFGDWVDGLDLKKYGELVHLYEHGWCQDVADLIGQVDAAIKDDAPKSADVMDVAKTLQQFLDGEQDATVVTITDGLGDKEDAEEKSIKEQARVPAGSPDGGQFASGEGSGGAHEHPQGASRALNILEVPLQIEHQIVHAVKGGATGAMNYVRELATGKLTGEAEKAAMSAITAPAGTITKIKQGIAIVSKGAIKASFITFAIGNKAAELVARAKVIEPFDGDSDLQSQEIDDWNASIKGLSESEVSRVKAVCAGYDVLLLKPVMLGLELSGMPHLATASTFVPLASTAYVAASLATNPIKIAKAAATGIKNAIKKINPANFAHAATALSVKAAESDEAMVNKVVGILCDAFKEHAGDEAFAACLPHAIEYVGEHDGNIADAIKLAELAMKEMDES
jgi:hypothetical protein